MTYRENVEAAASALKVGEDANWELARLTFENTLAPGDSASQVGRVSMAQWCSDVRVVSGRRFSRSNGLAYKAIWRLYGEHDHVHRPSWAEAYYEILGESGSEAVERQARTGILNASPEAKRETFQRLAADPEIVRDAMQNREIRANIYQAAQEHERERAAEVERKVERDPVSRSLQEKEALIDLEEVLRQSAGRLEAILPKLGVLQPGTALAHDHFIRLSLDRLQTALDAVRHFIDTGRTDVDAFLADVLKGEQHG